jgi:CubicO group peptidase (beta-lactamase class C family)
LINYQRGYSLIEEELSIEVRRELEQKIGKLAEPYLKAGKFTHIYAASGRFDISDPAVCFSKHPQGQDIFDLASLTKALVTVPLIFNVSIQDRLDLNSTVKDWLPNQKTNLSPRILGLSITNLLSHQSGLPSWRNFWIHRLGQENKPVSSPHEQIEMILNRFSSEISANSTFAYSDLGYILLGYILEKRNSANLSEIFTEFKRNTLGLDSEKDWLNYVLPESKLTRAVPTSFCSIRGRKLIGEVHDENCAALGGITGHAGLFGTGGALTAYLRALVLSPVGKMLITENSKRITPGGDPLLGWRQRSLLPMPKLLIGHIGFTGTAFWLDAIGSSYGILLTNRVISGRKSTWISQFRDDCMSVLEEGLHR